MPLSLGRLWIGAALAVAAAAGFLAASIRDHRKLNKSLLRRIFRQAA